MRLVAPLTMLARFTTWISSSGCDGLPMVKASAPLWKLTQGPKLPLEFSRACQWYCPGESEVIWVKG